MKKGFFFREKDVQGVGGMKKGFIIKIYIIKKYIIGEI